MKIKPSPYWILFLLPVILYLASCNDIIEPSISKKQIVPEAPADQYLSTSYTINFWWDEVGNALSYHLQVVTPNFTAPGSLVLDTLVTRNKFSFNFSPGNYQWRVTAQNGSSSTAASIARNFTVAASSIKQQSVQLASPANNFLGNQSKVTFSWGFLYGATQYRFEIDTNNFANETTALANAVVPGQQISFTLPRDQTYQWRVRAENDTAQAQWSAISTIVIDHTPPAQVTLAAPANGLTISIPVNLQWTTVATAAHYKLYVLKSDSTTLYNSTFPLPQSTTSYNFNLGVSGDKVYWKVTAVDAAGNESQASQLRDFVLQ
jgi:hypothetical protein